MPHSTYMFNVLPYSGVQYFNRFHFLYIENPPRSLKDFHPGAFTNAITLYLLKIALRVPIGIYASILQGEKYIDYGELGRVNKIKRYRGPGFLFRVSCQVSKCIRMIWQSRGNRATTRAYRITANESFQAGAKKKFARFVKWKVKLVVVSEIETLVSVTLILSFSLPRRKRD